MNPQRSKPTSRAAFTAVALFGPPSAFAAGGSVFEGLLLPLTAAAALFWILFFEVRPFRRALAGIPRRSNGILELVLGVVVLGFAGISATLGKTTLGSGVIHAAHEPIWFWNVIKMLVGVGCVLLVIGLLRRRGSK